MAQRKNISTHTPSEERVGYSRAVVVGNRMYVSGTISVDEQGNVVGKNVNHKLSSSSKKLIVYSKKAVSNPMT